MSRLSVLIVVMASWLWENSQSLNRSLDSSLTEMSEDISMVNTVLTEVLEKHLAGCHYVYIAPTRSTFALPFLSVSSEMLRASVLVDAGQMSSLGGHERQKLLKYLVLGDEKLTCRVLILVFLEETTTTSLAILTDLLAESRIELKPQTHIVGVGEKSQVAQLLSHVSLRNTVHALFIARVEDEIRNGTVSCNVCEPEVLVYRRCLYCNGGNAGMQLVDRWSNTFGGFAEEGRYLFPETYEDMMGHKIRVTAKDLFPFIEYEVHGPELGTTVTPLDSLDVRMLNTTARMLNFTYVMRMPLDDEWGTFEDGQWTGMVYTLQQELADISMMLFWAYERKQVIDFTRIYADEPLIMVTRKPLPTPQHLALVRPFQGEVWLAVVALTATTGVILWALQKAWSLFSGYLALPFDTAIMHSIAVILEDPVMKLPFNDTGRMILGWWMLSSMLVLTLYKSSLIAHLSVAVTPPPIDTVEQLLEKEGSSWGLEPGSGLGWDWFKRNENPDVQKMFQTLKMLGASEQMEQVLGGYHAFFTWKYYVKTIIGSNFTQGLGYTPIHISRQEFIPGPCGWGVRKGAPFLDAFDRIQDRLVEAGLVDYWLRELFETAIWQVRMMKKKDVHIGERQQQRPQQDGFQTPREGAVVLNLNHLQGAFYILFLGIFVSTLVIICENVTFKGKLGD